MNTEAAQDNKRPSYSDFAYRTLTVTGIITAVGIVLLLLWYGIEVLLLIFAGLLLAIVLRSLSGLLIRFTGLPDSLSLAAVLILLVGLLSLGGWLIYPSLEKQFVELTETLPQAFEQLHGRLGQSALGRRVLAEIPSIDQIGQSSSSNLFGRVTGFFSSTLGILVNILIVFMSGIYLAFSPKLYYEGLIKLVPQNRQKRAREVLDTIGYSLRGFLQGISGSMAINGVLTGLGLWFLGVPFAIPLAIITGLLSFIPNIGPISASIPAVLLALAQSPTQALYVAILYLIVQNLDGLVVTPLIQQRTVSLPPVLVISSQLVLAILFGFLGVLLAVPLLAVIFTAVRMLYVEDILGNKVEVKGEQKAKNTQFAEDIKIEVTQLNETPENK